MEELKWSPSRNTIFYILDSMDRKKALKKYRASSSGYIKKPIVREIIINKCKNKCVYCGSKDSLQIDHIESVKKCFDEDRFWECNTIDNLQLLCQKCNASKQP